MKKSCVVLVSLFALFLAIASLAVASPLAWPPILPDLSTVPGPDPVFDYTFSIGPDSGYGSLNANSLGGGEFLATTGTLTVTGGQDVGTYSLYPGGPGQTTSPSGYFYYDNVLYLSSNPGIDNAGLLFTGQGLEINIFSNGPGNYQFYDNTGYNNVGEEFTLTEVVPEPASLVLLGFGLAGLWFSRRKKA